MTYQVNTLNPKADKLLHTLAYLNLISISQQSDEDEFLKVVKQLRKKASAKVPTMEEITAEVEKVRTKRFKNEVRT